MDDQPAPERLAHQLRELRRNAGDPSYATIERWGRQQTPAVNLGKSKLSPWFKGTSVPTDGPPFTKLVELLEARAFKTSATPQRGVPAWRAMRNAADQERRRTVSGGPAPSRGDTPSIRNGAEVRLPAAADADKAGRILRLLPPDGPWQGRLRKAETMFRVPLSVSNVVCDALPALDDDKFKYVDPELQHAHEAMLQSLTALCFELNGMTDISDEGQEMLEISHPGTAAERNELNRLACQARDQFINLYWDLVNLLNVRGIASPAEVSGPTSTSGAASLDITVELQAGYTVTGGSVALLPIEVAGQVRSEDFSGPYFVAVRVSNPSPVSVQIAGAGIDIDCGAQVVLPYLLPPLGPGGGQLPFDLGSHAGGGAVGSAAEFGHSFRMIAEQGGTPQRVRAFARVGSGALFHGPWVPVAALVPFLTRVFTE